MSNKCILCNYCTSLKTNYVRHCKSINHLMKEELQLHCCVCDKNYKTLSSYKKHKNVYHKIIINHINDDVNNKNDEQNQDILNNNFTKLTVSIKSKSSKSINVMKKNIKDDIKDDIKHHIDKSTHDIKEEIKEEIKESNKQVIIVVNKAITKASSLIKYLMEHHQSAPPLKKINYNQCLNMLRIDFNCPEDDINKYCLEKKLIDQYKYGIFIEKLSKSILKFINHHDRKNQSIYNTDVTRNNYVVKTGACEWNEDIAGKRFCNYIIKPLLNAIKNLITNYRENDVEKISVEIEINFQKHFDYLKIILAFEGDLINGKILKPLLKELSPYLRYISEELENLEKMDELEKLQENLLDIINSNTQSEDDNSDENIYIFNDNNTDVDDN